MAGEILKAGNGKDLKFTEASPKLNMYKSGVGIYAWQLKPEAEDIKLRGIIFIAHGLGEHSRRYDKIAKLLCSELDVLVVSHDHVGHGRSKGERVMIETFDVFVEDVFDHLNEVKGKHPDLPVYLFGHSMGGSISILAACKKPEYFQAVLLSSPAIIIDPDTAPGTLKTLVGKMLNHFFPRMEILPPLNPNFISSDPEEVQQYSSDPEIWHGGLKLRFATVFGHALDKIKELIPTIEWPFLVIHGDGDKITCIGGSQLLEKEAKSQDKEIKIYEGLKHETLHEVKEKTERVMSDIVEWFRKRIPS